MRVTFLGATGTVTGSRYLVEAAGRRLLVDCGMFQGLKELRLRNWEPLPFDARSIDAVLLTHAHVDHSGALPLLVRQGFRGPIHATAATSSLCRLLLRDAARLQEEEARYANARGYSRHHPALPLFSDEDAEQALQLFEPHPAGSSFSVDGNIRVTLIPAGHILGASMVRIDAEGTGILFSGDLGRETDPLMRPPERVASADFLVVESTYGDRVHGAGDGARVVRDIIRDTAAKGGVVVVPAFCVGRAQELLHLVSSLKAAREIPDIPVFLNSPMASDATGIYCDHVEGHRLTPAQCHAMCTAAKVITTVEESKALNARKGPMIIIAGSGMATGGRVIHHIRQFGPDAKNTIMFAGYQAAGTRGARLVAGAGEVKIHGELVPIRARVVNVDLLSAHADSNELVGWMRGFERAPVQTFVTHGEPAASAALAERIRNDLKWKATVPSLGETVELRRPVSDVENNSAPPA